MPEKQGHIISTLAQRCHPELDDIQAIIEIAAKVADGDGILEIVLSERYYEGDWVDAYRVDGVKTTKLLTMGCGV